MRRASGIRPDLHRNGPAQLGGLRSDIGPSSVHDQLLHGRLGQGTNTARVGVRSARRVTSDLGIVAFTTSSHQYPPREIRIAAGWSGYDERSSMRLCTFEHAGRCEAGILRGNKILPISQVNAKRGADFPVEMLELINSNSGKALPTLSKGLEAEIPVTDVRMRIPYSNPGKVWCIGLNYRSHAEDLSEVQPEEPGSFMKPSSSFFEPGGTIELPPEDLSQEVDAEGELALVFGERCRDVPLEDVRDVLFGYTTTLDMTALDILARNTRYLQRAKSFDTFFSFGPVIVTVDEIDDIDSLEVLTVHNSRVFSRDFVANMKHRPLQLAAFHSRVMTFEPGDILSTGCPKGARIRPGDTVEARIEGVGQLHASVTRRGTTG